jgi:SET domain
MDESAVAALAAITSTQGNLTPVGMAALRSRIAFLESELLKQPQIEPDITNHFSLGVYAREMRIKKDTLVVGAIHKFKNMNVISKGRVTFFSIDGAQTVEAPYTFVASPGVKRVIYAHEDTVWTTIHGTDETDVQVIEQKFIAKNYDEAYLASERDLADVLAIIGATPGELQAISENEQDMTSFDREYPVEVYESKIDGLGLFAKKTFNKGEIIAPARIKSKRTPAGRYSNHSGNPNAEMMWIGDCLFLIAKEVIESGEEILTDYFFNYKTARREILCHGQ